ncbi:MAG: lipase chaperone [Burkholderiales bacterium]|nr:lipase chaperone [Burkholderiales bacterium]
MKQAGLLKRSGLVGGGLIVCGAIWAMWHPTAASPVALMAPVASQRGSVADGAVSTDLGRLAVNDALRRRFDYALAALGERSLAQITASLDAAFDAELAPPLATEAKRLFRQYLAYRDAIEAMSQDSRLKAGTLAAARARMLAMRTVRARFFNSREQAGLFGWQDAYDDDAMARLEIEQDATLSLKARQQRLAELDRNLPPEILAERQAPVRQLVLADAVRTARAQGADDAAVYRLRAANVGEEAATRLAAVDQEERDWQQRIKGYLQDRAAILADKTMDETARADRLQQLRDARFDALEQKRLAAYEP